MQIQKCQNHRDFRNEALRRLPRPVFDYIDGGADDETTLRRNSASFADCDLVPKVLAGVSDIDLSVTVMGQKLALPVYCSPVALQRLFHHEGETAVAAASSAFGTMFGVSSLGTASLEAIRKFPGPQVYQLYFHKDRGLNAAMLQRAKAAGVNIVMLTVDSITGGNRERDKRSGFAIPFRLTPLSILQFALRPQWALNYLSHEKFSLPQARCPYRLQGRYHVDQPLFHRNAGSVDELAGRGPDGEGLGGQFCLKGIMSAEDARKAADIGCTGIVVSNHGGRQLDGSRSAFDQLGEIVDAAGDRLDVLMDGGVQRGSHVLKALSLGAKAVGLGRYYLFPLAVGGRAGVERALQLMREELIRDMRLMGCRSVAELSRSNLRFRFPS